MLKGIDVSDNNGKIDWQAVKNSGIDFAILRVGFGNDDTSQDDKRFFENANACDALGIPWGAYIYSYAMNTAEAESEAAHCMRLLNGRKPLYPVCLDMEDADGYKKNRGGLTGEQMIKICDTFLSSMEEKGYYVALYSSVSWLAGILDDRRLDRYDKWVAQWNTECEYSGAYGLWQYGGSTNYLESPYLSGISGAVDKNYALYDYPSLIRSKGLNGWEIPAENNLPKEEDPAPALPDIPPLPEPESEASPEQNDTPESEEPAAKSDKKKNGVSLLKRIADVLFRIIRSIFK